MTAGRSGARSGSAASAYAFSARPGRVSSWLSAFAARPTRSAPETLAASRAGRRAECRRASARRSSGRTGGAPANPRSGPPKRSSARPSAATAATRGSSAPTIQPTSGQAQAAVVDAERAEREHDVAQLAAAVQEPAQVAPGRTVAKGQLDLLDGRALRRARRTSSACRSRTRRRAGSTLRARLAESARCPESGSRSSRPGAEPEELAGGSLGDPEAAAPAAPRTRRSRGRRRARAAARGRRRGRRRTGAAAPGARPARRGRAPGPCRAGAAGRRAPRPPRRVVRSRRASRRRRRSPRRPETRRAAPTRLRRSAPPRRARRRGSSAAQPPSGGRRDLRQDAVVGGLLHPVLARGGAAEQEREREAAGLGVEVVDGREVLLREGDDRRVGRDWLDSTPTAGTPAAPSPA